MTHSIRPLPALLLTLLLAASCGRAPRVPAQYTQLSAEADIYPDYKGVTVPPNIAPLNFMARDTLADAFVAQLSGGGQSLTAEADRRGVVRLDTTRWRALLHASRGGRVRVDLYARRRGQWARYKSHTICVAREDIDPYLTYRLIEPGYELYRQLGIYQRHLTNWDERPVYENNREYNDSDNHCINCHNYRMNSARDMLFHVRANHGGTVFVRDGKAHKVQIKDSAIVTSGVYPSWHPTLPLVAFSTNKTGQTFHIYHTEKLEVMDEASDLLLYDVRRNEVSHILRTSGDLETFPCWAPDGRALYYCNSAVDSLLNPSLPDSTRSQQLVMRYRDVRYDLMALDFDPATRRFSKPRIVVAAASQGKSVSVPRVSPDGRYVLYTLGDYGQFHIWHKSSDLWVKDLRTGECRPLTPANSPDADSFHSWSSNGRWIVFSSRRMDGNYTRPFITYFDRRGRARKAFVLPQEDPETNTLLLKSYNVPELTRDAVRATPDELRRCVLREAGQPARYIKRKADNTNHQPQNLRQ